MTGPWQLFVANPGHDWKLIDTFASLAATATQINGMEDYPTSGVFLEVYIDALTIDAEAGTYFEHCGRKNRYVIKREAH